MHWFRVLTSITSAAVLCPVSAMAQASPSPDTRVGVIRTTARLGQFCSGGQFRFLLDQELPVSTAAQAWAAGRRLVVRYSEEAATVTIEPPKSTGIRQIPELLNEITGLMMNATQCPANARTIPANITVDGLDIVQEGGGPDFRLTP